MKKKPKKKPEATITVSLRLSVAKDLVTVLSKFSIHKMDMLQLNQKAHADRLLGLNLFRVDVEAAIRKVDR